MDTVVLSLELKWLECDDHIPPSNTEVETEWSYTSTFLCTFMTCMGQL
jgi:hypothetical protein